MGKAHPRKYPRLSVRLKVEYTAREKSFSCEAKTLSGGGLFLTGAEGLTGGEEISVRFRAARHLPVVQAKGRVRYIITEGAAIEFTEIADGDRHKLLRLIHQKTGNRRLNPRAPLATQLECDRCMTLAFSRDVSLGGMFIETTEPLPVGTVLTVRFNLNQMDKVVTASAQVAYHVDKMGMGVFFTEITPEDREAIRAYIESLPPLPTPGETENTPSE